MAGKRHRWRSIGNYVDRCERPDCGLERTEVPNAGDRGGKVDRYSRAGVFLFERPFNRDTPPCPGRPEERHE